MIANPTSRYIRKQSRLLSCAIMAITLTAFNAFAAAQDGTLASFDSQYESRVFPANPAGYATDLTSSGSPYFYIKVAVLVALASTMLTMIWMVLKAQSPSPHAVRIPRKRERRRDTNPAPSQSIQHSPIQTFTPTATHVGCFTTPLFGTPMFSPPITVMPSFVTPQVPLLHVTNSPLVHTSYPSNPAPVQTVDFMERERNQDERMNRRRRNRRRRNHEEHAENHRPRFAPTNHESSPRPERFDSKPPAPTELRNTNFQNSSRRPQNDVSNSNHVTPVSVRAAAQASPQIATLTKAAEATSTPQSPNTDTTNNAMRNSPYPSKVETQMSEKPARSRDPMTSMFQKIVDENLQLKATRQQSK